MSSSILLHFPDLHNSSHSFPAGVTGHELVSALRPTGNVLAVAVAGKTRDLALPITEEAAVRFLTWPDQAARDVFWHSSAHLLAEALEALYPGVQFGVGPAIERGFYYDVDFGEQPFDASHLAKVEKKMLELAARGHAFQRRQVTRAEAMDFFVRKGDVYKQEIISGLEDGTITFYTHGGFTDLCRGPHLPDTSPIKAVKLLSLAGAYWRGDSSRRQLTRIYGITFPSRAELKEWLAQEEEARKRDHRKLGRQLGIFTLSEEVGLGLPLWLPKGTFLREQLMQLLRGLQELQGYQFVTTPHIGHKRLYETSGHYQKYIESSFRPIATPHEGDGLFMLKPMNCPHHCVIFGHQMRSYRELPLRMAEFGTVYRYEQHGELHGLTRTRGFTQDDAHIFCAPDQLKAEFLKVMDLVSYVFGLFGFQDYAVQISVRDPQKESLYLGNPEAWAQAEQAIQEAAEEKGMAATRVEGEAAFYGPKLDFTVRDSLGRKWQLGTIQIDYNLPERFDLTYIDTQSQQQRPVMIHRAIYGSLERFIAILLEHTAGRLPLWLAPVQVHLLPVADQYLPYAREVASRLRAARLRVELDARSETISRRVRDAELLKVPYIAIVGEREQADDSVAVRRAGGKGSKTVRVEAWIRELEEAVAQKAS